MPASSGPLRSPYRSWMFGQIESKAAGARSPPASPDAMQPTSTTHASESETSSQLGALLSSVRKQHADLRTQMGEVHSPSPGSMPPMPSPAMSDVQLPPAGEHRSRRLVLQPPQTDNADFGLGSGGIVEPRADLCGENILDDLGGGSSYLCESFWIVLRS